MIKSLVSIISGLFPDPGELRDRVITGQYDLLVVEGGMQTIIIPDFLESTIKPGASISMQMWLPPNRRPTLPPSRFTSVPLVGPGPGRNMVTVQLTRRHSYKTRDAEVNYRLEAIGFGVDFVAEMQREGSFGDVLTALTNATDGLSGLRYKICDNSDSDSDTSSLADADD